MVRLSITKILGFFLLSSLMFIIWKIIFYRFNQSKFYDTCQMTDEYLTKLNNLLQKVHQILESASLTHILCYSSLWGQIRLSKLLPWSRKAEFCIFSEELDKLDDDYFREIFTRNNLEIVYDTIDGFYAIRDSDEVDERELVIEIYVFVKDDEQRVFKRVGFMRRVLPPNCDWSPSLDCFPTYLIQKPLPLKSLGNYLYPVAMGGIELQKYHYSENWWKEVRLKNCNLR